MVIKRLQPQFLIKIKDGESFGMIFVGIDIAKDKHDCFIANSEGNPLCKVFTIENNAGGFHFLYEKIITEEKKIEEVKIGIEATGHYSYNILNFLIEKGFRIYVINPLHTNMYRKSLSLRKTKTDTVDAKMIASMLLSNLELKEYSSLSLQNENLKSLTRYRFDKIRERAKLKQSITRLVCILFPEIEALFPSVHLPSVYSLLKEFPGAEQIADADSKTLYKLLYHSSKGKYGKDTVSLIKETAKRSIGSRMPMKSMELRHTIRLIGEFDFEIEEVEREIKEMVDCLHTPILSIPGISYRMGAMILAEVGDFNRFDSADKVLAYAGLSPSTYQSGQMTNAYSHMEKRGSKYLRYALFNATKYVCNWDPVFKEYLAKKRAEGKAYNVAISHAAKKLVRVIYQLEKSGENYERRR